MAIGLVLAAAVMATDHRWVRIVTPAVYAASIVGLVLVLVMGTTINGSRSWLMLGGMSVQPAEFAKLAVVTMSAMILAERMENSRGRGVNALDVFLLLGIAGHPRDADHAAARPRHDAGPLGHGLRRARRRRGPAAVAHGAVPGRCQLGDARGRRGVLKQYQINRFMAFTTPPSTRAAPATTPPRRASRSATAACSGGDSSTARRPARGSCPSSTPTSSSPSRGRSSACRRRAC